MDPIQLLAAAISGGLVQWVYRVIRSRYRESRGEVGSSAPDPEPVNALSHRAGHHHLRQHDLVTA